MTGFTLGDATGATLGTEHGGTLGTAYEDWRLDGALVPTVITEAATHETLTLTWRVSTADLNEHLRPLKRDEEKVTVLPTDDGGFIALDRAGGENTYQLGPPNRRQPLRQSGEYHVLAYEETLVSQDVDEWDVEIEFVPAQNRSDEPSRDESRGPAEWGFETRFGELAVERVSADVQGTGADGVEHVELVATLTHDQSHVLEAALSRLGGVRVQPIDDATNAIRDDAGTNTLGITPSDGADGVESGDYVAVEFESVRLNDDWQRVEMDVVKID